MAPPLLFHRWYLTIGAEEGKGNRGFTGMLFRGSKTKGIRDHPRKSAALHQWNNLFESCGGDTGFAACFAHVFELLLEICELLLLGGLIVLELALLVGPVPIVAQAGAGIGVESGRLELVLALEQVELLGGGINFLFLLGDLAAPLLFEFLGVFLIVGLGSSRGLALRGVGSRGRGGGVRLGGIGTRRGYLVGHGVRPGERVVVENVLRLLAGFFLARLAGGVGE